MSMHATSVSTKLRLISATGIKHIDSPFTKKKYLNFVALVNFYPFFRGFIHSVEALDQFLCPSNSRPDTELWAVLNLHSKTDAVFTIEA